MTESLESLGNRGAKMVRLDAFGYATKKLDTRCFMEVLCLCLPADALLCLCMHDKRLLHSTSSAAVLYYSIWLSWLPIARLSILPSTVSHGRCHTANEK